MSTNVEKAQKQSELDDRSDALKQEALQIEQQTGEPGRSFWLRNLKIIILVGILGLIIIGYIRCK
jgi:vesicle-associated membrane protein 2